MAAPIIASQALGFTVEFTVDESYEKWHPYDPDEERRSCIATLKVGATPIYSTDWMIRKGVPMAQQLENAAADLLTRMWGIESQQTSTGSKDILPKREYPEKGDSGY